jgi:electron transfer flavoprotein alpha/beta subunit
MHARLKTLRVTETPARKPGIMVADVAELIARLHDEGVIG